VLIRKLLFDVRAWDASILAGVSLVLALALAALLASYLPVRRAASVNPTEALHAEWRSSHLLISVLSLRLVLSGLQARAKDELSFC
jgi:hypothetical protein